MKEMSISMTQAGVSGWIEVDRRGSAHQVFTLLLDFEEGAGVATVEFSIQANLGEAVAIPHNILCSINETTASRQTAPVWAFRLNVNEYTSGTVTLRILQAGYYGN